MQRSDGGLFVDMYSFLAFGKEYVMWNYEKTGNPVYLNIQESPKQVSESRPHKKPTLLAIGMILNSHFLELNIQSVVWTSSQAYVSTFA